MRGKSRNEPSANEEILEAGDDNQEEKGEYEDEMEDDEDTEDEER